MSERRTGWRTTISLLILLVPMPMWGQQPEENGNKVVVARFTSEKIIVDGALNEPAWQTAELISGFTQKEPEEGKPSTELTEVRLLYDKEYLYVGAYCYDRTPDGVVLNDLGRDFSTEEQDYFGVVLDTFNDDRNGYYMATTVAGNQRDSQFFNEGRENNANWDGVWYSKARWAEDGYTVEIAIPFNTLRFSRQEVQVWGAQFFRKIRRRNEPTYWSPVSRRYSATTGVSQAGELRGIENVEPGRNLQLKPYALAGVKQLQSQGGARKGEFDGGVDLKYGVTPGLTLDLTLNTDFSHVEADSQQVNLTRFPLFFQEKREFFLENAGIFQFGSLNNSEALLFHSRTIGLADGEPIPILGGARLSGRAGQYYLGLLNMQTRSEGPVPATSFTVTRLRRNILGNSDVGAMFLNRESGLLDDHNRAFGADTNLLFSRNTLRASGTFARTFTPGRSGQDQLGKLEGEYRTDLVRVLSSYVDIGENFNPEMGFVRSEGRRIIRNELELIPRVPPENRLGSWMRYVTLSANSRHTLLSSGETEIKYLLTRAQIEFQDGSLLGTHYERNFERLLEPDEIHDGIELPSGDYRFNESKVWYDSDSSKRLSGRVEYLWADYYSGKRKEIVFGATVRPSYRLSTNVEYERNDIDLPEGAFTTNLLRLRADYSFNTKMFLNAFVQYNSDTDQVISNIRFRLIHRPLSDMFVVYNDVRDREQGRTDWSLNLKYTHLLNF